MKKIVALLFCALLSVQPAYAMQVREPILYTDTQEEAGTQEEAEAGTKGEADVQEEAETGTQEGAETKGEANVQKEAETGTQEDADEQKGAEEPTGDGSAGSLAVSAPSAVLMEASTGQVIYDKDADTQRPPASVTKVMTLLLIFDALEDGKIKLEDQVTTSEYAASMGGSQVFLEPGEVQTVDTLIKCISVASANDACAAYYKSRMEDI